MMTPHRPLSPALFVTALLVTLVAMSRSGFAEEAAKSKPARAASNRIESSTTDPVTMIATFSIVAVDPKTGVVGAAVASKYPAVGKVVPYVKAGVGAFCTQHYHNPKFGPIALDLLEQGKPPEEVLRTLLEEDKQRDFRQLAVVDAQGRAANINPSRAPGERHYWGGMTGTYYACQGNTLAGRDVVTEMGRAYEETEGSLADKLIAALRGADRVGGDHRGRLAAGIRVAKPGVEGNWLELDVDRSDDAVEELVVRYTALEHEAKGGAFAPKQDDARRPAVPLIFDTDMGNDIDDALALGVIHALQSRGECNLLAVTISKDNEFAAPYVELVNTFYGRAKTPIGVVRDGKTPEDSPYIRVPAQATDDGRQRYPHELRSGKDAPEAVAVLRQTLSRSADASVVVVVVGFSTNLARLLDSPADNVSPLNGRDLVKQKCKQLVMMAGMFTAEGRHKEYNVFIDLPAARKVYADWPTPIVTSGFEIGRAIKYPAVSILQDYSYVKHHPLSEAYGLYQKMPYDRETWDLTAVLYAVRPERGYFGLSPAGTITVDDAEVTQFAPGENAPHRFLTVTAEQIVQVREALVQLASQPPVGSR
ncbi:MAG: DUF1028 domain-containing protein [Planctomycetota bacterium]|nr:DUF1028 domain-containing protein [Planctomycetota bacterium]